MVEGGLREPAGGAALPSRGRSARRDATRERVLDAAREVFAERGVIGGTVEDICERAGFTRGAFYSNFEDKDDLLRALIAREHARLIEHLDAGFAQLAGFLARDGADGREVGGVGGADGPDDDPTMPQVVDRLLRAVPDDRHFLLIQTELEIHAIRVPDTSRAFMEADAAFRARIADFLERGLRLLGRELTVDVGDVTEAVIAIVDRGTRRALLSGRPTDPDALARAMLPVLIGAASRPRPPG
jgi:AcrR family transcriptional regulator